MRKTIILFIACALNFGFVSCSWVWPGDEKTPDAESMASSSAPVSKSNSWVIDRTKDLPQGSALRNIEIIWQVPTGQEPVEKYHIFYGPVESKLDQHREVKTGELQKIDDPQYGPVFRYLLAVEGASKTVFFAIQAENGSGTSSRSPVQKVEIR